MTIIGLILIVLIVSIAGFSGNKLIRNKYKLKQFLTQNEKDFFRHLCQIYPDKYICPQVSMGAILQPVVSQKSHDKQERSEHATLRNKIGHKIIDFIILNNFLEPEFIIELDDKSHDTKINEDKQRDIHLSDAGLKTIRIRRQNGKFPDRRWFDEQFKKN